MLKKEILFLLSGTEIKIGSDDLVIIKESDIMGIMG